MAQDILTGKFRLGEAIGADQRAHRAGDKMVERIVQAEQFRALAEGRAIPQSKLALRYTINPDAVSAVISGVRTVEQVTQNVTSSPGEALDDELLTAIAEAQREML